MLRYWGLLLPLTAIAIAGLSVDKQVLTAKRYTSRQHFRLDVLRDRSAVLRAKTQQLSSAEKILLPSLSASNSPEDQLYE
ncbi:hypothetical protein [Calycomorphotria hydatis]|uniref:Uncharacterized protein n=1 Tax=Calycomorphotria hydatis TaxID=2528027 RepID=A0A517T9E0_9PLAN|nr:hypothetical protein [Calycomorphotria hydatis]QDT64992.1 hypothetical protein V22_22380 [Calycomorphotria hydatis]